MEPSFDAFATAEHNDWPAVATTAQPWKDYMVFSDKTDQLLCGIKNIAQVDCAWSSGGGY